MLFSFNTRKNTKKFADDANDKKKANEKLRRFMLAMLAWAKFDTFIIDETKGRRSKPEGAGETDLTSEPMGCPEICREGEGGVDRGSSTES